MVAMFILALIGLALALAVATVVGFCGLLVRLVSGRPAGPVGRPACRGQACSRGVRGPVAALLLLAAGLFIAERVVERSEPAPALVAFAEEIAPPASPINPLADPAPSVAVAKESDGPSQIIYPEDRPEWVVRADEKPRMQAGEAVEVTVSSGPHVSWGEARRALDDQIDKAAAKYVDEHLGIDDAAAKLRFKPKRVETYEEQPIYSIGPMKQSHALLVFDKEFDRQIERKWREHITVSRLSRIGVGALTVLGVLTVIYGYFMADAGTRGAHRRRLKWGAGAALAAVGVGAAVLFRWLVV